METKKDCFGYHTTGGRPICSCMTDMVCRYTTCSFYKSKEQYKGELMKIHGTTNFREIERQYIERMEMKANA